MFTLKSKVNRFLTIAIFFPRLDFAVAKYPSVHEKEKHLFDIPFFKIFGFFSDFSSVGSSSEVVEASMLAVKSSGQRRSGTDRA